MKWIDKKSVLTHKGKVYKAGDALPADLLAPARLEYFRRLGKIEAPVEAKKSQAIAPDEITQADGKKYRRKKKNTLAPEEIAGIPESEVGNADGAEG